MRHRSEVAEAERQRQAHPGEPISGSSPVKFADTYTSFRSSSVVPASQQTLQHVNVGYRLERSEFPHVKLGVLRRPSHEDLFRRFGDAPRRDVRRRTSLNVSTSAGKFFASPSFSTTHPDNAASSTQVRFQFCRLMCVPIDNATLLRRQLVGGEVLGARVVQVGALRHELVAGESVKSVRQYGASAAESSLTVGCRLPWCRRTCGASP